MIPDPLIFFKQSACWAAFSQQSVSTAAVLRHVQNCLSEGTAVSHLSLCVCARVCVCIEDVTLSLEGRDKAIDFTFGPLPCREVDTSSEYVCGCVYVLRCKIDNDKNEVFILDAVTAYNGYKHSFIFLSIISKFWDLLKQ